MPNRVGVANGPSLLNPHTQRKNLARDKRKVCVLYISKQKLRAGVEKGDAHVEKVEALKRLIVEPLQRFNIFNDSTSGRRPFTPRFCPVSCGLGGAFCLPLLPD